MVSCCCCVKMQNAKKIKTLGAIYALLFACDKQTMSRIRWVQIKVIQLELLMKCINFGHYCRLRQPDGTRNQQKSIM